MISIQRQLQSRISVRRNSIRWYEKELLSYKTIIKLIGTMGIPQLRNKLWEIRGILKHMRADQKLDKVLYAGLVADAANERAYRRFVEANYHIT